jgi:hypothetical protein
LVGVPSPATSQRTPLTSHTHHHHHHVTTTTITTITSCTKQQYKRIAAEIEGVPGVLAHGLVVGRAAAAVIADAVEGVLTRRLEAASEAGAEAAA